MAARFPAHRCQLCGERIYPGQPLIEVRIATDIEPDENAGLQVVTDRAFPTTAAWQHQSPNECPVLALIPGAVM